MQLAVACDIRVAALGARMAIPGGRLGIPRARRNIWRLAMLVGQGAARDFLLAGRTVDAEEALRLGLVQRVARDALADALATRRRDRLARAVHRAGAQARRSTSSPSSSGSTSDRTEEVAALEAPSVRSDDLQEGLAAFAEKRNPEFRGQ